MGTQSITGERRLTYAWSRRRLARNREALKGKRALYATLEALGMAGTAEADELKRKIQRLRVYIRNATGEEE